MGQKLLVSSDNISDSELPEIVSAANNKQAQPADAIVST
jgi:hypothetical protein